MTLLVFSLMYTWGFLCTYFNDFHEDETTEKLDIVLLFLLWWVAPFLYFKK